MEHAKITIYARRQEAYEQSKEDFLAAAKATRVKRIIHCGNQLLKETDEVVAENNSNLTLEVTKVLNQTTTMLTQTSPKKLIHEAGRCDKMAAELQTSHPGLYKVGTTVTFLASATLAVGAFVAAAPFCTVVSTLFLFGSMYQATKTEKQIELAKHEEAINEHLFELHTLKVQCG